MLSMRAMNKVNLQECAVNLASDPVATMILLGLGLDEFSMTASSIPLIKKILRSVSKAECEEVANKVLTMDTAEEITDYAKSVLAEKDLL